LCIVSARRKKPAGEARLFVSARRWYESEESSGLRPGPVTLANGEMKPVRGYTAANASTSVDLPLPFSPTRNVMPGATSMPPSAISCATAGIVNGHSPRSGG